MTDDERLIQLLAERSARRGQFTLASGKQSSFYIDARLTTMSPEGLVLIGRLALERLRQSGWAVDAVGGLTLGADPISYAISYASADSHKPVRAFTVRKEAKAHELQRLRARLICRLRTGRRCSAHSVAVCFRHSNQLLVWRVLPAD